MCDGFLANPFEGLPNVPDLCTAMAGKTLTNDRFLRACRREETDKIPLWFMRQAGRYQKEYRTIREKHSFMEVVHTPEVCAEVTMLPIHQMDVDAAILFSDIATPFAAFGVPFDIIENRGPVIEEPVRTQAQVEKLHNFDPEAEIPYVGKTIQMLQEELEVPLIGFGGAPFTLASYIIEGGGSKNYLHTRQMMYREPMTWHRLMEKLADMLVTYLTYQAHSGADALQLFDSWVGTLSRHDYQEYVFPHMQRLFEGLKDLPQPIIHFGVGTHHFIDLMQQAGGDVIGIDWRMNMERMFNRWGGEVALQGNLDPGVLLGPWELVEEHATRLLEKVGHEKGFIFNLGHGIFPPTPPEHLQRLVELVHNWR